MAIQAIQTGQRNTLTEEQVCDLPMDELLAQVDVTLDTTEINEPGFFGYSTVHASGRATVYIPSQAGDLERDIATRFLVTKFLGLPTHLFPDVLQATVYDANGEEQA
ncbi:hypothetical protein JL475_30670 [Streptomyces sp. M2CJ-2]|uniref:hypothetical protein n=1 Tax=Streptomyces sp. M2CJ-2 TaxID=2803948 RepID=UPI0019271F14|nr:hypothetical protein [Streptomyces sp. M2CJ-2]MBL3670264.1 hypothetical protein [Streptomyces sp. M2CJ-2]